jgi:hypothetical protein
VLKKSFTATGIEAAIVERHVQTTSDTMLDPTTHLLVTSVRVRGDDHIWIVVDANDFSLGTDSFGDLDRVNTWATSDIDNVHTRG